MVGGVVQCALQRTIWNLNDNNDDNNNNNNNLLLLLLLLSSACTLASLPLCFYCSKSMTAI